LIAIRRESDCRIVDIAFSAPLAEGGHICRNNFIPIMRSLYIEVLEILKTAPFRKIMDHRDETRAIIVAIFARRHSAGFILELQFYCIPIDIQKAMTQFLPAQRRSRGPSRPS
jgi:hypothetical protein